jgi:hypothetical protein
MKNTSKTFGLIGFEGAVVVAWTAARDRILRARASEISVEVYPGTRTITTYRGRSAGGLPWCAQLVEGVPVSAQAYYEPRVAAAESAA